MNSSKKIRTKRDVVLRSHVLNLFERSNGLILSEVHGCPLKTTSTTTTTTTTLQYYEIEKKKDSQHWRERERERERVDIFLRW